MRVPLPPVMGLLQREEEGTWTIRELVMVRLEVCTEEQDRWNSRVALQCLGPFGVANAATLFVRHRERERARMGLPDGTRCEA